MNREQDLHNLTGAIGTAMALLAEVPLYTEDERVCHRMAMSTLNIAKTEVTRLLAHHYNRERQCRPKGDEHVG